MASMAPPQSNGVRQIEDTSIFSSLNLKIENNLGNYMVLLVGINDNNHLFTNLPMLTEEKRIESFNKVDDCCSFIDSHSNNDIFLVISGTLGKLYASELVGKRQIIGIYVYCMNRNEHIEWSKDIEKIRLTVSDINQLFNQLYYDIKQLGTRWPFDQRSFQKASMPTSQWFHLFLLIICHPSTDVKNSNKEMFDECRKYYENHSKMLRAIRIFEDKYRPESAIHEYTKDSFVYRIINHALRTQNIPIIRKFRPFIRDLHQQLYNEYVTSLRLKKQPIHVVYRGQTMALNEIEYLRTVCSSRNPVITLPAFGSTSLDPDIAFKFASPERDRLPCVFEIIIPDEYHQEQIHKVEYEQVFAKISSFSAIKNEKEVLFSLATHFCVKYVGYPTKSSCRSWVPIVLEVTRDPSAMCHTLNRHHIMTRSQNENEDIYNDILDMLEENATNELKFDTMNWTKWWGLLSKRWGTDRVNEQPLNLVLYDSFTDNLYWSRKAIEMHKNICRTIPSIESNRSSFSELYSWFIIWQSTPTKAIALYEQYLKELCTTDEQKIVRCLFDAGKNYQMISDKERALECYEAAKSKNANDQFKMNREIEKKIRELKKTSYKNSKVETKNQQTNKLNEVYEVNQEQWPFYWNMQNEKNGTNLMKILLNKLVAYLKAREYWYDVADAKIVLRLSVQCIHPLPISVYRNALQKEIIVNSTEWDATSHPQLCQFRYEKYFFELKLFKELEQFLEKFRSKTEIIGERILPQLSVLMEKIAILIQVCKTYIPPSDFIEPINIEPEPLIFFNHRDDELLRQLNQLQKEEVQTFPSVMNFPSLLDSFEP